MRVLVVDDEENLRLVLRTVLTRAGYAVQVAATGKEALGLVASFDPDFVLADVRMPGMSGLELCRELHDQGSRATVIVMSAFGSIELALEAMKAGAYDYVSKPFKHDEVLLALKKAEERQRLRKENEALRAEVKKAKHGETGLDAMVGTSPVMKRLYTLTQKVAGYPTTVLLQGESGSGKELVARAIHRLSPRAESPFVAINCGAIPEALLESELFGHRKGAFTDAHHDKAGLFDAADHGTLFLDEIGELPIKLQVKLLRVLQEGQIRALGDTKDKSIDVRVVAATVRNLKNEVAEGRFREDLYYRLNVLQIDVPPLRERTEDIPLLCQHFIERYNERLGTDVRGLSGAATRRMLGYDWPGNVRELENSIERAMVLSENEVLDEEDLPERLTQKASALETILRSDELSIKKSQRYMEEALIRRALEHTDGNRTQAAKLLEISHRALLYKIKDYAIEL